MFCIECGKEIPNNSIYCHYCGFKVINNIDTPKTEVANNSTFTDNDKPIKKETVVVTPIKKHNNNINQHRNESVDTTQKFSDAKNENINQKEDTVTPAPTNTSLVNNNTVANNELLCPKCGSKNLHIMTETNTTVKTHSSGYSSGSGCLGLLLLGPFGLLCGLCGSESSSEVNIASKSIWNCQSCGHKFRSPEEIKKDIDNIESTYVCETWFLIIGLLLILLGLITNFVNTLICLAFLLGIYMVVVYVNNKPKLNALKAEYDEVVNGMNKFR